MSLQILRDDIGDLIIYEYYFLANSILLKAWKINLSWQDILVSMHALQIGFKCEIKTFMLEKIRTFSFLFLVFSDACMS